MSNTKIGEKNQRERPIIGDTAATETEMPQRKEGAIEMNERRRGNPNR
jgi:hypothetical protein